MLRMNKRLEYGILALLYLSGSQDTVSSVRELAKDSGIPEALLGKIMQRLKNAGFVVSLHGNHGGYRLVRNLRDINLLDLTNAVVGPVQVAECLQPGNETCPVLNVCKIIKPMNLLNQKIMNLFQATSLQSLTHFGGGVS